MALHVVRMMDYSKTLLVAGILLVSIAAMSGPLGWAQAPGAVSTPSTASAEFEAATIKPVKEPDPGRMHDGIQGRRFLTCDTTFRDLIMMAYELNPRQISGGPAWVATDEYDIDAVADSEGQMAEQREEMLQKLLADRFKPAFHREQRQLSVYSLIVGKSGSKLKVADPDGHEASSCAHPGVCTFRKRSLQELANYLGFNVLDKVVLDKTGLAGTFDFDLKWTPDESQYAGSGIRMPPPTENPSAPPGLFTAIQEQLGLKLEPQKIPSEVLVIDHVERPSEN